MEVYLDCFMFNDESLEVLERLREKLVLRRAVSWGEEEASTILLEVESQLEKLEEVESSLERAEEALEIAKERIESLEAELEDLKES